MDGADSDRQFVKLHFNGRDPVADKFIATNIHSGTPMVFIMDPKVYYLNEKKRFLTCSKKDAITAVHTSNI